MRARSALRLLAARTGSSDSRRAAGKIVGVLRSSFGGRGRPLHRRHAAIRRRARTDLIDKRDAGNPARPVAKINDASGRFIGEIDLARGRPFFEPFSRVTYLESPDRDIRFPAGTSRITVTMRDGSASQRYVLSIGSAERFSAAEIPYLVGALYRIHARKF